jgi:hypothetical protein
MNVVERDSRAARIVGLIWRQRSAASLADEGHSTPIRYSSSKMALMSGPLRPGPPATLDEAASYTHLKSEALRLHYAGRTHAAIAGELGLERSSVTKMLARAKREVMTRAGSDLYPDDPLIGLHGTVEEKVYLEYWRLQALCAALYGRITAEPEVPPKPGDVNAYVRLSARLCKLVGADGCQHQKVMHRSRFDV